MFIWRTPDGIERTPGGIPAMNNRTRWSGPPSITEGLSTGTYCICVQGSAWPTPYISFQLTNNNITILQLPLSVSALILSS